MNEELFLEDVFLEEALNSDSGEYESLKTRRITQEKILAEIFFGLSLSLSKLAKLSIAHRNLRPENILLDRNLNPVLSDFSLGLEHAGDEYIFQDLLSLGKIMQAALQLSVTQKQTGKSWANEAWVFEITQSLELLKLRAALTELADATAGGQIDSIDKLLTLLVKSHPKLLSSKGAYFLPAAITL